jgi:hypothetical protein
MADIHIHREHRLGLAKARKTARQWAGREANSAWVHRHRGMKATSSGSSAAASKAIIVDVDSFDLTARLSGAGRHHGGRAGIEENLDAVLADQRREKSRRRGRGEG